MLNNEIFQLIAEALIIIWDEAPMMHRYIMEALDRALRDLMRNSEPFGGKILLLGGDFRQILPVIKHASRVQIVESSLKKSALWKKFKQLYVD